MKYIIISGVVILIAFIVALSFIPIGIEPLTEVYFENHTKIPANVFLNRTYNFTFTVHNMEYKTMTYRYNVTEVFGGQIIEELTYDLANVTSNYTGYNASSNATRQVYRIPTLPVTFGEFTLENNESITLSGNFNFTKRFDRAQILVNVTKETGESIDIGFWVDEIVPIRIIIEKSNSTNSSLSNITNITR